MPQTAGSLALISVEQTAPAFDGAFCDGATLTLERRFAMPGLVVQPPRVPGFAFRIYCMAPSGEQLQFYLFRQRMEGVCGLLYGSTFMAWKEFCIPYERGFMLGHTAPDALCRLCIQAETGGGFSNILFAGYSPLGGSGCTFCLSLPLRTGPAPRLPSAPFSRRNI